MHLLYRDVTKVILAFRITASRSLPRMGRRYRWGMGFGGNFLEVHVFVTRCCHEEMERS